MVNVKSPTHGARSEYQSYADQETNSRFIIRDPIYWNNLFHQEKKSSPEKELDASGDLQGNGGSVGVASLYCTLVRLNTATVCFSSVRFSESLYLRFLEGNALWKP